MKRPVSFTKYRKLIHKALSSKRRKALLAKKLEAVADGLNKKDSDYMNQLVPIYYGGKTELVPRQSEDLFADWLEEMKNKDCYISSAFRSTCNNEVFMFLEFDYIVIKYDPASPNKGCLVKGPLFICDGFPSLYGTSFDEYGVDAAFSCHGVDEAFIFSGDDCAKIKYDPDTRTGDIIKGHPKHISRVFPFLDETANIDAAFESTVIGEAYLFEGERYVLCNYRKKKLIATGLITDAFPCLHNTIFSSDIGAAFASHTSHQAYLFKDNSYVLIHYIPGETSDSYIIVGPEEIVPTNWPFLRDVLPYNNFGRGEIEPKTWIPLVKEDGFDRVPIDP